MTLDCPRCNVPIDYSGGETLFTCVSCGYTFSMTRENKYEEIPQGKHFMLVNNYTETGIQEVIRDWMGKTILKAGGRAEKWIPDFKNSEMNMMELRFVPIWIVNVSADTTYNGQNKWKETKRILKNSEERESSPFGGQYKTTTKVRTWEKSGHISDVIDWKILPTKGIGKVPLKEILGKVELSVTRKIPFKIENVPPGAKLINGNVDEKSAKKKADSGIRKYHRRRASGRVDQLFSVDTNVQVGEAQLLTVPFCFIRYKYKEKLYPVILNGSSGEVVEGKVPILLLLLLKRSDILWYATVAAFIGIPFAIFMALIVFR